jgi:Family of unknown function (DUF6364)
MAKLVLDIEPSVIDEIKKFADEHKLDLSKLTENYFKRVTTTDSVEPVKIRRNVEDFSPWIQQIVLSKEPTPDFDHKAEYGKHLEEKYGL